jgi:hypothetical protein
MISKIIIGEIIALVIIVILFWRSGNVKKPKVTKSKRESSDKIPHVKEQKGIIG